MTGGLGLLCQGLVPGSALGLRPPLTFHFCWAQAGHQLSALQPGRRSTPTPPGRPLVMPARLDVRPHTAVAWRPPARGWGLSSQARSSGPALLRSLLGLVPSLSWPLCPKSQGRVLPWRSEARPQTKQGGFPEPLTDAQPGEGGDRLFQVCVFLGMVGGGLQTGPTLPPRSVSSKGRCGHPLPTVWYKQLS